MQQNFFMKQQIIFATHNQNKCKEINALIGDKYKVITLDEIGISEEIPENGNTFKDNALQKASYLHDKINCDCFADDSGLIVEALNGEPGVYSARYAGEPCDMKKNITKLLNNLAGLTNRKAKFHTTIALIINDKTIFFEGSISGKIIEKECGENGFGYDPIFVPDGYNQTFAELSNEEKNSISHRAIAVKKLIKYLQSL